MSEENWTILGLNRMDTAYFKLGTVPKGTHCFSVSIPSLACLMCQHPNYHVSIAQASFPQASVNAVSRLGWFDLPERLAEALYRTGPLEMARGRHHRKEGKWRRGFLLVAMTPPSPKSP